MGNSNNLKFNISQIFLCLIKGRHLVYYVVTGLGHFIAPLPIASIGKYCSPYVSM